ncbi:MAG: ribonuclease H-like domain-containing protein [Candidatus Moraniibacteriota bacterium]
MPTLIFDIETVGENFDEMDETTQEVLLRWTKQTATSGDELKAKTDDVKNSLGFSPFTGFICAIGILDAERDRVAVYYQTTEKDAEDTEEEGVKYRPMSEKAMLEEFWRVAEKYDTFVSFNGRSFDVPFLMLRSMILGVRPTRDLLSNRYTNLQRGAKHIDVMDQLTFYGAMFRRPTLHIVCRSLGIKSPKADGVTGDDVAELYHSGKFLDIARYNVGDLHATRDVYARWQSYLQM